MRKISVAATLGAALLAAGCSSGVGETAAAAASSASTTVDVEVTSSPLPARSAPADAIETYGGLPAGPLTGGQAFLDEVDAVWPLTADRTTTVQGYRVAMCAARQQGVTESMIEQHIVEDFAKQYGATISQDQGDAIAAAIWPDLGHFA